MTNIRSRILGLAGASALPATVAGIMFFLGRWDWPILAIVLILSVPLYVVGRDSARPPSAAETVARSRR